MDSEPWPVGRSELRHRCTALTSQIILSHASVVWLDRHALPNSGTCAFDPMANSSVGLVAAVHCVLLLWRMGGKSMLWRMASAD